MSTAAHFSNGPTGLDDGESTCAVQQPCRDRLDQVVGTPFCATMTSFRSVDRGATVSFIIRVALDQISGSACPPSSARCRQAGTVALGCLREPLHFDDSSVGRLAVVGHSSILGTDGPERPRVHWECDQQTWPTSTTHGGSPTRSTAGRGAPTAGRLLGGSTFVQPQSSELGAARRMGQDGWAEGGLRQEPLPCRRYVLHLDAPHTRLSSAQGVAMPLSTVSRA